MENNIKDLHHDLVEKIIYKHFNKSPEKIERMKVGLANEVYSVQVEGMEYIVRMNKKETIKGSGKYIPLFKSKGIKVPELLAEDYSQEFVPYSYQILKKIEGVDIKKVISTLSEEELRNIAKEIVNIINKLNDIPTNGMYGFMGVTERKLVPTMTDFVSSMLAKILERNAETGVVDKEYLTAFAEIVKSFEEYLKNAPSKFYFDDMSSKNVIIHNGKFNGIVDLDVVMYGDYLESIGRIKASWYGTTYGEFYTNAIMEELNLDEKQRRTVTFWALLNAIWWQSELGIKFNENSSTYIDPEKVEKNNLRIEGLIKELAP